MTALYDQQRVETAPVRCVNSQYHREPTHTDSRYQVSIISACVAEIADRRCTSWSCSDCLPSDDAQSPWPDCRTETGGRKVNPPPPLFPKMSFTHNAPLPNSQASRTIASPLPKANLLWDTQVSFGVFFPGVSFPGLFLPVVRRGRTAELRDDRAGFPAWTKAT